MSEPGEVVARQGLEDLEDLFENAPCGYLASDKDGRIVRANRTLAGWIGVEAQTLLGQRFSDLLTVGGKIFYETHFAPMLRMQGAFNEVALDLRRADGSSFPALVNAIERRDEAGNPLFIRITIFNASGRRSYERSLLTAKANAEAAARLEQATAELREQFIAVLGHDLRNPLAAIVSGLKMLAGDPLDERQTKVLRLVEGSALRASQLIDDVLDLTRVRLGSGIDLSVDRDKPLEPVIRQVVAELQAAAPDRAIQVEIDIAERVEADYGRLGQLMSNLLGNALSHGAEIEPVRFSARTDGESFELIVANGGDPISEEERKRLFQPFFRGAIRHSRQGLGLGLYIASEIAKAHGGTLTVASDPQETRFTFRMPLSRGPDKARPAASD